MSVTPLPWEVNERAAAVGSRKRPPIEIRPKGVRYQVVADDIRRIDDAEFIVAACNLHGELVETLADLANHCAAGAYAGDDLPAAHPINVARALLAKVDATPGAGPSRPAAARSDPA